MAECATDPPAFQVEYGTAGLYEEWFWEDRYYEGVLHIQEAELPVIAARVAVVDPCVEHVNWATDRDDWAVPNDDFALLCSGINCWNDFTFFTKEPDATGTGLIWILGLSRDGTEVAAAPLAVEVLNVEPRLDWAASTDVPPWEDSYSLGAPPQTLTVGIGYWWRLVADLTGDDLVLSAGEGDPPPGLFIAESARRAGVGGEWNVWYEPAREEVGSWAFDIVATDEEGTSDTVAVRFEVVEPTGCRCSHTPALLHGGLAFAILHWFRRRR